MTKAKQIARISVQVLSLLLALAGLNWIYASVTLLFEALSLRSLNLAPEALVFGGVGTVCLAVACQVVFRYSLSAISNLTAITGFFIYTSALKYTGEYWINSGSDRSISYLLLILFFPLLAGAIYYLTMKRLLRRFTIDVRPENNDVVHVSSGQPSDL